MKWVTRWEEGVERVSCVPFFHVRPHELHKVSIKGPQSTSNNDMICFAHKLKGWGEGERNNPRVPMKLSKGSTSSSLTTVEADGEGAGGEGSRAQTGTLIRKGNRNGNPVSELMGKREDWGALPAFSLCTGMKGTERVPAEMTTVFLFCILFFCQGKSPLQPGIKLVDFMALLISSQYFLSDDRVNCCQVNQGYLPHALPVW